MNEGEAELAKRKWIHLLLTIVLMFSLLPASFVSADAEQSKMDQIDPELLKSIKERYMKTRSAHLGTKLDPKINVKSDEKIKVIVEFYTAPIAVQKIFAHDSNQSFNAMKAKSTMAEVVSTFLKNLATKSKDAVVTQSYDTVFSGVALEIKASDIPKLQSIASVRAIYPNNKVEAIPIEKAADHKPYMAESAPMIGANEYWNLGYEGAGMKVGVIDTGIDYNHPDLKAAYKGGYDFVDNDADPYEGNEMIQSDHGTHVSGIISGRGNPELGGVRGIAPKSDLHVYRVLGENGGEDAWVIAGIEQAVKDGMDVINLSLGAPENNPDTPTSRAVNNAMLAGVVTVVANGNYGTAGYGTVTSPATAALAISVGASYPPYHSYNHKGVSSATGEKEYELKWMLDWSPEDRNIDFMNEDHELVYVGLGRPGDFEGKDVAGKIVLVKQGGVAFTELNNFAEQLGAVAVIFFNRDTYNEHLDFPIPRPGNLPMFDMRGDDGRELVRSITGGTAQTFKITGVVKETYPGDDIVDFSSKGPVVSSFDIKPDIVAPGANILSTVPAFGGAYSSAYARLSGTSMAAPHITGLAALILEAKPNFSVFDVKTVMMNTAKKLNPILREKRYNVLEMGAGRVQALDTLNTPVLAQVRELANYTKDPLGERNAEAIEHWTGSLNFGMMREGEATKTITLKNISGQPITYQVSSEINLLYTGPEPGDGEIIITSLNSMNDEEVPAPDQPTIPPSMRFSQNEVMVPANGTATVEVTYKSPSVVNDAFDGYVYLTPVGNENVPDLQVPFITYHTNALTPGIGQMGFSPKYLSLNGDGINEETTFSYELLIDMAEAYLFIENTLDWERTWPLGFVKLNGDNLKKGKHSIQWDGHYTDINTGETKLIGSSLYGMELVSYDKLGLEYHDPNLTSFIVLNENTPISIEGLKENNRIEVTENKISGMLTSTAAEIARDWWFLDQDFWGVLQLDYKIKVDGNEYKNGSLMLKNNYDTPLKTVEFDLEGELPAGESTLDLIVWDRAGNRHVETYSVWYDADTSIKGPREISYGNELKLTLSALQVQNLVGAEFFLEYRSDAFRFDRFELTEEFAALGNVLTPSVTDGPVRVDEDGREFQTLQLGAVVKNNPGEAPSTGLSGNIPVLNVYFTPRKDVRYLGEHNFTITKAQKIFVMYNSITKETLEGSILPIEVYTNPVKIKGKVKLQAFLDANGEMRKDIHLGNLYDLSPDIQIYDHETKRVIIPYGEGYRRDRMGFKDINIFMDSEGNFEISNLHPGKIYDIKIFYPSHFETFVGNIIPTTDAIEGRKVAVEEVEISPELQLAGDLDRNHVIDIYDVALTSLLFGAKTVNGSWPDSVNYQARNADINKDGEVDILDLSFTTTNYGKVNTPFLDGSVPR
jgi:minor extracellular serine protease Vpr